jgi:hypothetical protein
LPIDTSIPALVERLIGASSADSVTSTLLIEYNRVATEWADPLSFEEPLKLYYTLVEDYSGRTLSFDEDAIHACSGILDKLEERYFSSGFFKGIPRDFFVYALSWHHFSMISPVRRRKGFPSWSWVGWEGKAERATPLLCYRTPQRYVQLFETRNGQRTPAQAYPPVKACPFPTEYTYTLKDEVVFRATRVASSAIDSVDSRLAEDEGMLLVDGVLLEVYFDSRPAWWRRKRKSNKSALPRLNSLNTALVNFDSNFFLRGAFDCLLAGVADQYGRGAGPGDGESSVEEPSDSEHSIGEPCEGQSSDGIESEYSSDDSGKHTLEFIVLTWDRGVASRIGFLEILSFSPSTGVLGP